MIEIALNFLKMSRAHQDLKSIAFNYIQTYFVFDVLATMPCLFSGENRDLYPFKSVRLVHVFRIS